MRAATRHDRVHADLSWLASSLCTGLSFRQSQAEIVRERFYAVRRVAKVVARSALCGGAVTRAWRNLV